MLSSFPLCTSTHHSLQLFFVLSAQDTPCPHLQSSALPFNSPRRRPTSTSIRSRGTLIFNPIIYILTTIFVTFFCFLNFICFFCLCTPYVKKKAFIIPCMCSTTTYASIDAFFKVVMMLSEIKCLSLKLHFIHIYWMNQDAVMTTLAQWHGGYIEDFVFCLIEMSSWLFNSWVTECNWKP